MAHPLLEAVYLGLFAGSVAQPIEVPKQPVMVAPGCIECATAAPARAPRVVYDWASGTRSVYASAAPTDLRTPPAVGVTEWRNRRLDGPAAG